MSTPELFLAVIAPYSACPESKTCVFFFRGKHLTPLIGLPLRLNMGEIGRHERQVVLSQVIACFCDKLFGPTSEFIKDHKNP